MIRDDNAKDVLGGIFDRSRPARGNAHRRWEFADADLNVAARKLFAHLEIVQQRLGLAGRAFLSTIELDVETGRFPEVVAAYFAHPAWDHASRFSVGDLEHVDLTERTVVGRLTFASMAIKPGDLLAFNDGFRWGANLLVGGVQVPEHEVARAIRHSPFNVAEWVNLAPIVRCAWAAARDLNALAVWVNPVEARLGSELQSIA